MKITRKKVIWIVVIIFITYVLYNVIGNPEDFVKVFNKGYEAARN